jgi:hypothetical protein
LRRCGQIAANGSGWEQGEAEEAHKTIVKAMDRTEEYGFQPELIRCLKLGAEIFRECDCSSAADFSVRAHATRLNPIA